MQRVPLLLPPTLGYLSHPREQFLLLPKSCCFALANSETAALHTWLPLHQFPFSLPHLHQYPSTW